MTPTETEIFNALINLRVLFINERVPFVEFVVWV